MESHLLIFSHYSLFWTHPFVCMSSFVKVIMHTLSARHAEISDVVGAQNTLPEPSSVDELDFLHRPHDYAIRNSASPDVDHGGELSQLFTLPQINGSNKWQQCSLPICRLANAQEWHSRHRSDRLFYAPSSRPSQSRPSLLKD